MTRWFTADLHLGHANIIRYCDRPYADVDVMDRDLVARWNDTVAPADEVWVPAWSDIIVPFCFVRP